MATNDEDVLPPEVRAQVDKIKAEGDEGAPADGDGGDAEPARAPVPPERPLSRRQQAEQERLELIRAADARAAKAEELVTELRTARERDVERLARMEALLEHGLRQREPEPQRQAAPVEDPTVQIQKLRRQATDALASGKLDEYHDLQDQITDIRADVKARQRIAELPRPEAPQMQKPAWVQAVEAQFPEVVTHANGLNTVAAFAQIDPSQFGPEKLKKAFTRARDELGLGKKRETPEENGRRREMLSGGPVNGSGRAPAGKGEKFVNVPKNYREIARRAGMTPEDYVRSYAQMNPGDVGRE